MPENYGDYSLLTQRRAGQAWSGGQPATQWAWSPQPDGTSRIAWGHPSSWPPPNFEVFRADPSVNWVYLLGYGDTAGQWLPQVVTAEWSGDANAANWTPLALDPQGRQHYARWTIPSAGYSLYAVGYMMWQGAKVDFIHQQKWAAPRSVANAYHPAHLAVTQSEVWADNFGNPGGSLVVKQDRDAYLAKGLGMTYIIVDRHASWRADLRYSWAW
jgi:hypothetical protein